MHATDIVAYTYKADIYTQSGIIEQLIADGLASPAARDMRTEDALTQIAEANAINRFDERTYDSSEFPKVVFADMIDGIEYGQNAAGEYVDVIEEWSPLS